MPLNMESARKTFKSHIVAFKCLSLKLVFKEAFTCTKELFDVSLRGILLSCFWFRSYSTCRHHRTVIDGCESLLLPISSGVPQGSNLGPLLFIINMNMAPKAIHSSTTVQLYADDIKCFRIVDNTNDV